MRLAAWQALVHVVERLARAPLHVPTGVLQLYAPGVCIIRCISLRISVSLSLCLFVSLSLCLSVYVSLSLSLSPLHLSEKGEFHYY